MTVYRQPTRYYQTDGGYLLLVTMVRHIDGAVARHLLTEREYDKLLAGDALPVAA